MKTKTLLLMGLSVALLGNKAPADITSGLIAHWTFDETSGLAAADSSGLGNDASLYSFPTNNLQWVRGVIGGALFFNGDIIDHNDYVLTDKPLTFTNQLHQYSFSFWIKRMAQSTGTYPRVISPSEGAVGSWWILWGQGGGVGMSLNPLPSDSDPAVGEWIHYAVVADQDAKQYSVYSNTVPVLSNVADAQPPPPTVQWMIGHDEFAGQPGDYWIGALDDVRVYNRFLAAGDVQQLYDLAPTPTPTNAPVFVQNPQGGSRPAGCNWSMYGTANGDPAPLAYQWQKGGTNIDGATDVTLTLTNLAPTDAGSYTLVANNGLSSATSQVAVLQVESANVPPYETGMIAHWTFDETNGSVAADSSVCGGNDAALFNFQTSTPQWVPGVIGGGLFFNSDISGHDDYVLTDGPLMLGNPAQQYSFSFWIKRMSPTTGSYPRVISPLNGAWWVLWGQGGGLGMNLQKLPGADPAVGQWIHYVVTADLNAGTYDVFSNTVPQLTDIPVGDGQQTPAPPVQWMIGHNEAIGQSGDFWIGVLDDVRAYNRLLTQTDVQDLFNLAATITPTNPPVFLVQPQGGLPTAGFNFTMFGTANGDPAPSYQWQKNGTNVPGATAQTLVLGNLQLSDSGSYVLVASNFANVAYSQPAVVQVQPAPLVPDYTNGLIAWWKFDETNGLKALDSSGLSNNATLFNYPNDGSQWTTGRVGGAVSVNILAGGGIDPAHNDYILTDNPINFTNQDEFTFAFWINRLSASEGSFPRIISPYNVIHWVLYGGGGGPGFYPPVAASSPEPLVGVWEHFVVSFNRAGGTYNVYRNGTREVTGATVSKLPPGAVQWMIAHNEAPGQPGDYGVVLLDDLRVYNRLFADIDASALYDSAPAIQPTIAQQSVGTYYEETGQPISFSVRGGGGQLKYQWQKGTTNITGATSSTLTLSSVQPGDAGTYTVIVYNTAGTVTGTNIVLQVSAPGTVDLTYGLMAYWKFDETTGLLAADSSGRSNSLMLINYAGDDSQWVTGRIGGALSFNTLAGGSVDPNHADYGVTGDGVNAQPLNLDNQDQFSFCFWIDRSATNVGTFPRVIVPYDEPSGQGWVLFGQGQGMGFYPPAPGSQDPPVGAWEHYVVTYERDTGVYNVFQNGVLVVTNAAGPIRTPPGAEPWIVGHNENPGQNGDYFVGALDDVRIYNRLLTAPDVAALAKLGGIIVRPTITITRSGQSVMLTWPAGGILQSASKITGPFNDVAGSPPSPQTVPASGAAQFFRVRVSE
jgi:hypothetical protein